jgi:hypothetical protein
MLLTVLGLLGAGLILFGLGYFYLWRDSLAKWLDRGETREARWVLVPLLMIVGGAGLVFLAIQPARAEERHDPVLRKLVYGSNFALTALLLVVALVVANVLFTLKVPNKLDTTETGFYSLSRATEDLLRRLDPPVTAQVILPDTSDRRANDIRQLLIACQDESNGRFAVRFVDEVANRAELNALMRKYPQLELVLNQQGFRGDLPGAVLLTSGEDGARSAVIPAREFSSAEGREEVFVGESRLFKELAFLADNQTKPVVYFTQGNGELSIAGEGDLPPERSAARFKAYLEKNYLDVRPLALSLDKAEVPADADVVVVAGPRTPLPEAAAEALRRYVTGPKKGKLVVLAGAVAGPDGRLLPTGLEGLLSDLNVRLGTQFVFSIPLPQMPIAPDSAVAVFSRSGLQNPILQAIIKVAPSLMFYNPRVVEPVRGGGNPAFQATDLMLTDGLTWVDDRQPADLDRVIEDLLDSEELRRARNLSQTRRVVAVTVTEGATARAAVFGTSAILSDRVVQRQRSEANPLAFDLIGVTVDWLRDRPAGATADIAAKKYSNYRYPQPSTVDTARILYLPLGLAMLAVVGLGAGVWVIRRK